MKINAMLLSGAALLSKVAALPTAAQATTLTFDALTYEPFGYDGDGALFGPTVSDGQTLFYWPATS